MFVLRNTVGFFVLINTGAESLQVTGMTDMQQATGRAMSEALQWPACGQTCGLTCSRDGLEGARRGWASRVDFDACVTMVRLVMAKFPAQNKQSRAKSSVILCGRPPYVPLAGRQS